MQEHSLEELVSAVLVKIEALTLMIEDGDLDRAQEYIDDAGGLLAEVLVDQVQERVAARALEVLETAESLDEAIANFKAWGQEVIFN